MDLEVLRHFLDFWIQVGDFKIQTRVFAIALGQVFAFPMDIAATVVLNKSPCKEVTQNLILLQLEAFLHGFMYFRLQGQHPLLALRPLQLLIWRSLLLKRHTAVLIGGGRRSQRSSNIYFQKYQFLIILRIMSSPTMTLKIK